MPRLLMEKRLRRAAGEASAWIRGVSGVHVVSLTRDSRDRSGAVHRLAPLPFDLPHFVFEGGDPGVDVRGG